jgi:Zn finger protein HypA/HybF involved in hydrogenase expression
VKRLSQSDFIDACIKKHGNLYDYSLVNYINISKKIQIICKKHGIFNQISKNHKDGQGCPKCSGRNITKEDFINECEKKHKNKFLYFIDSDFVKSDNYIKIFNKENKLYYTQLSDHHRNGINPTKIESQSLISKLKIIHNNKYEYIIEKEFYYSTDIIKIIDNLTGDISNYRIDRHLKGMSPNRITISFFKLKGSEIHKNKYDYSLVNFNKSTDKVKIICPKHGEFLQNVSNHINCKDGCPKCGGKQKWIISNLIDKLNHIHNNKYDYSGVNFTNIMRKIDIICPEHGVFSQIASKHLNGQGCPRCKEVSKGEKYIIKYLDENDIKYHHQYGFDTCKYINKLTFDFYLPYYNLCIEFDGRQHFEPVEYFGGQKEFESCIKRDNSKDYWCKENNLRLVRIPYTKILNINEILKNNLKN